MWVCSDICKISVNCELSENGEPNEHCETSEPCGTSDKREFKIYPKVAHNLHGAT